MLQEGDYLSFATSARRLFAQVDRDLSIRIYSELNNEELLSLGALARKDNCTKKAYTLDQDQNGNYLFCSTVNGAIVQFKIRPPKLTYFGFDNSHLFISLITAVLCSLLIILIMQTYFTRLFEKINKLIQAPRTEVFGQDLDWLKKPILDLYDVIESFKGKLKDKERNDLLSKVVRQVAHDLGAPMSAFSVLVTRLEADQSKTAKLARSTFERLRLIISDLKEQSQERSEALETFSFNAEIRSALIPYDDHPSKLSLKLRLDENLDGFKVYGNRRHFRRIIECLIQNSIEAKHSDRALQIEVQTTKTDHKLHLSIKDNGIGIPKDQIDAVSLPGVSIGKEQIASGGSGLGLSFAAEKVEEWGGQLKIESLLTRGTSITIALLISLEV